VPDDSVAAAPPPAGSPERLRQVDRHSLFPQTGGLHSPLPVTAA